MFSGKIAVRKLHPEEVSPTVIHDLNHLLRRQHGRAKKVNEKRLLGFMKRSTVVVAWNDGDRILAVGTAVKVCTLSHSFVSIHNLVVHEGCDALSIGQGILDKLKTLIKEVGGVDFIEAGVWLQDEQMKEVLTNFGFKEKPNSRYRLRLK